MPPRKPQSYRLRQFVDAATRIFSMKGYRRTQMADVTNALGLSAGSIYRYIESKEALFDLCLRAATEPDLDLDGSPLPVPSPAPGTTLDYLKDALRQHGQLARLDEALRRKRTDDARGELEGIVLELYSRMREYNVAMHLVESCALDWPQLARLWFEQYRSDVIDRLEQYLKRRIDSGLLRSVPSPLASARLMVTVVVFLAVERHNDPYPVALEDDDARATALDTLVHALMPTRQP